MITLFPASEAPAVIRKSFVHDEDVFFKARDFYHRNKDMRHHKVVVYDEQKNPIYCLGWEKNRVTNSFENPKRAQMQLSNYWDYSLSDDGLDFSYVDRYELIIYEKVEEYSYHTARIAMAHNPKLKVAFTDMNAAYFFEENDNLYIAASEDDLFKSHPSIRELKTLRAHATLLWNAPDVFMHNVPSYEIMTSLYWLRREFYYGPLNPDKTFYLIKQPVKENGLTALISNVIGVSQMIRKIRPDFIPIVDLAKDGDNNQFVGTSGEDVWGLFFKQLSPYSLEEVYNSQHVILDQNSNLNFNPYFTEFLFSNARAELKYGDDLQYLDEVAANTDSILSKVFPQENKHILAVVVRGTDYLLPKLAMYVPHGITAEETLDKAMEYVREMKFDYVFLATEDSQALDLFLNSELGDKLLYVDQKRFDYREDKCQDKLLYQVMEQEADDDPYQRTLTYIAVLEALTRCDALLANVTCGAVTYALGRCDSFEFVDVCKIDNYS